MCKDLDVFHQGHLCQWVGGGQHQDLVPDTDLVWKWGLLPAKQVHREVKQGSHISGLVTGDAGL